MKFRFNRSASSICSGFLLLASSVAVHAQPQPGPRSAAGGQSATGTAAQDEASAMFRKAIAAHDAGRLTEAEELFLKAWSLKKTWDIAANLGLVQQRLGKHAAAAEHLAKAAHMVPPTEPPSTTTELVKRLDGLRSEVATIRVRTNVLGGEVYVNGEAKGVTPLGDDIFAAPGEITVEVKKDGYSAVQQRVQVAKGEVRPMAFVLAPREPEATEPRKQLVIAGAVLGGAALVAGAILAGVSASKAAEADGRGGWDRCYDGSPSSPDCPGLHALRTDAAGFGNGAAWLFIGGAAVGGATVAYALLAGKPASAPQSGLHVTPVVVGGSGGGLLVQGSF